MIDEEQEALNQVLTIKEQDKNSRLQKYRKTLISISCFLI